MGKNATWDPSGAQQLTNKKTTNDSRKRGFYYEDLALNYLLTCGLTFVTRNFVCHGGEIDLIMHDQDYLVFIEVRYRQLNHYGHNIETISPQKCQRLIRTALFYLQHTQLLDKKDCRFDILGINASHEIAWLKNAITIE